MYLIQNNLLDQVLENVGVKTYRRKKQKLGHVWLYKIILGHVFNQSTAEK